MQKLNEALVETQPSTLDKNIESDKKSIIKAIHEVTNQCTRKNEGNSKSKEQRFFTRDYGTHNQEMKIKCRNRKTVGLYDKVELNVICKIIKNKLRILNADRNKEFIENILNITESTKKIKNHLSLGREWVCVYEGHKRKQNL